ncbi:MAG: LysM peptidoglycan-binding domain-containing M23 family metallopeptidase [Fretibacterium sp.]|nr:LysM peptidoglycan-binding domain-containing M23 family metallopeptidase [Fretibacterium sp.]
MLSAGGRFSGIAWGSLMERPDEQEVLEEGFIVIDLSDVDLPKGLVGSSGALTEEPSEVPLAFPPGSASLSNPSEETAPLPLDAAEMDMPDLPLPKEKLAHLELNLPADSSLEDFGPLPRDLSDFESIVLNAENSKIRLPGDGDENIDLSDMELPEEELDLANVGSNWVEHVVKSGETLSDIALVYGGITAQDILRANGLKDANRLAASQLLLIPNSAEFVEDTLEEVRIRQARVAALREEVKPLKVSAYVVVAGDSLWSIANAQNLELDTLVGSNSFKDSAVLHPGLALRIPNQDGIFYTLKKGDSLSNVAKRYQVNMDKIRKVNPTVDLISLKPGDEVFLPGARPEALADVKVVGKKTKVVPAKDRDVPAKGSRVYRWPLMGRINSAFGWRRHPITKRQDFHTGIDIKASRGAAIRSARAGRVAYSGWMGGYGKVVVVDHGGGHSTFYAHCSQILVRQGAKVARGDTVARVGTTGRSTGPHLHFEVRKGNRPVNPLKYLK